MAPHRLHLAVILFALLATGCAANVTVEQPTIPEPHIEQLPLSVAVRIPAKFNNFVHEENVLGRETWTIDLGSANAAFFKQLFSYMFENVIILGPDDNALDHTFDALVEPDIEGFEFSVPNQSKTDAFAVWIRYKMRVFDSAGNSAASWTVSAYGKSQKEGIGGSKALQRAAVLAMRDAAALILLQMNKATKISDLADGPLDIPALGAESVAGPDAPPEPGGSFGIFAIGGIDDEGE
ncbi:MAG: hypothetical protein K0U72_05015 [Gammaproteobacteria bacterium]|nr:hypothetical protein [Gammaproteobacteria bacterium]